MKHHSPHHSHLSSSHSFLEWLALVVCTVILLASVWYIVKDIAELHHGGYMRFSRQRVFAARSLTEIQSVRSWMAFSYINKYFGLPGTYLKDQLGITAKNYPAITVSTFAASQKISQAQALQKVQAAIYDYLRPQP